MELLHVGDVATGFDGKTEARVGGDLFGPGMELVIGGQAVEAAIDLYGWEVPGIVGKIFAYGEVAGVEALDPMGVNPTRSTDPDHSYPLLILRFRLLPVL